METIIKEVESAIEKAEWNVEYHKKQMLDYSEQLYKLTQELKNLKELIQAIDTEVTLV